mmetsp:Transcript_60386/g.112079  ORF Transcript_60386/g.112079 Transcript_60386/m.112079 type:complete len:705 (+) Transcript_60386:62-2176(+)
MTTAASGVTLCSSCGRAVQPGVFYCAHCGAARDPQQQAAAGRPGSYVPPPLAPQGGSFVPPPGPIAGRPGSYVPPPQAFGQPAMMMVPQPIVPQGFDPGAQPRPGSWVPPPAPMQAPRPSVAQPYAPLDGRQPAAGLMPQAPALLQAPQAAPMPPQDNSPQGLLRRLYGHLDGDGDGVLSPDEMHAAKELLKTFGDSGATIAACLDVADRDRDGLVSREDWRKYTSQLELPPPIMQGVAEILKQFEAPGPPGWSRRAIPGKPGQLGFYRQDMDLWVSDAAVLQTMPGKQRVFDALLIKLGKVRAGVVSGLQFQAVCDMLNQQGGVGSFLVQNLQQADVRRMGAVDRDAWIRHFINVNVCDQELVLMEKTIEALDATELDEMAVTGSQGQLPAGWQQQESSSRPGVFYYVHSSLALTSRLKSIKQVVEVERALGIFDRLLQVFATTASADRSFNPTTISAAARTLPQFGTSGVMLMQILNTADQDRDGSVSRSDWANYFCNVGIPVKTLKELEMCVDELWQQHCSSGMAYAAPRPSMPMGGNPMQGMPPVNQVGGIYGSGIGGNMPGQGVPIQGSGLAALGDDRIFSAGGGAGTGTFGSGVGGGGGGIPNGPLAGGSGRFAAAPGEMPAGGSYSANMATRHAVVPTMQGLPEQQGFDPRGQLYDLVGGSGRGPEGPPTGGFGPPGPAATTVLAAPEGPRIAPRYG